MLMNGCERMESTKDKSLCKEVVNFEAGNATVGRHVVGELAYGDNDTRSTLSSLRDRARVEPCNQQSDTVFIMGISRSVSERDLWKVLCRAHACVEMEWDKKLNKCWAKYSSAKEAMGTVLLLHQTDLHGVYLAVKFELGVDSNGKHIVSRASHNTLIRRIVGKTVGNDLKETYTNRTLEVCGQSFPFPTGMYLSRMINIIKNLESNKRLLDLFTDGCMGGSKYSKEITEAMAMADCTERAIKMILNKPSKQLENVDVFVLGDGKRPLGAGCTLVHFPSTWKFYSIDPLLEHEGNYYHERIQTFKGYSQDFDIHHHMRTSATLFVVIACHSHAPLQEFWSRMPTNIPKIAVAMPCCADYSELNEGPVFEFDDYEVYSPKRHIRVYAQVQ
eukprot:CFRG6238T1